MNFNETDKKAGFQMVNGASQGISINQSLRELEKIMWKAPQYHRENYENQEVLNKAKDVFRQESKLKDPFSGKTLVATQQEAKRKYGDNWTKHAAEADHIIPLKKIYVQNVDSPWLTEDDICKVGNNEKNIKLVSANTNRSKGEKTNKEYIDYLQDNGKSVNPTNKKQIEEFTNRAEKTIEKELFFCKAKNVKNAFCDAGEKAAKANAIAAAASSMITNMVAVIKGEKKPQEALQEIGKDTLKTAATSYVKGGATTVIEHTLASRNA